MGHPHNTLYMPTRFHRNVHNIQSAISATSVLISAISVPISVISVPISAIPIAISAMSVISIIFTIPETSVIPT